MVEALISTVNAEHYTWGEACDAWFLVRNAEFTVIQEKMPPDATERLHKHILSRQFFYVLSGTATMEHGSRVSEIHSGEGIEIAPGVAHRIANRSTSELNFLVTSQPPSHKDRMDIP